MDYYYINTDTAALGYSPHVEWLKYDHVHSLQATMHQTAIGRYGERILGTLNPGDILFMYANQAWCCVSGTGFAESWDRVASYKGNGSIGISIYGIYRISNSVLIGISRLSTILFVQS